MDELHHPQGFYIEQMVEYAKLHIPEEDTGRVRCASFKSFNHVCKFIAMNEGIPVTRVYPSLRYIGYNDRYHNMKNGNVDQLYEMGDLVKQCVLTRDPHMIELSTEDNTMFENTISSTYRIKSDAIAVAMKDAEQCGIKVSELNLFNALEGLDIFVSNEPDYILLRDDTIFKKTLKTFDEIKDSIYSKTEWMKKVLR